MVHSEQASVDHFIALEQQTPIGSPTTYRNAHRECGPNQTGNADISAAARRRYSPRECNANAAACADVSTTAPYAAAGKPTAQRRLAGASWHEQRLIRTTEPGYAKSATRCNSEPTLCPGWWWWWWWRRWWWRSSGQPSSMTAFIEALPPPKLACSLLACSQHRRRSFRREMGEVRIGPRSNIDISDSALVYG